MAFEARDVIERAEMNKTLIAIAMLAVSTAPVLASHNNPWATSTDTVLAKNHDANQLQSIDTPGEDEMKGRLIQNVSPNAGVGLGGSGGKGFRHGAGTSGSRGSGKGRH